MCVALVARAPPKLRRLRARFSAVSDAAGSGRDLILGLRSPKGSQAPARSLAVSNLCPRRHLAREGTGEPGQLGREVFPPSPPLPSPGGSASLAATCTRPAGARSGPPRPLKGGPQAVREASLPGGEGSAPEDPRQSSGTSSPSLAPGEAGEAGEANARPRARVTGASLAWGFVSSLAREPPFILPSLPSLPRKGESHEKREQDEELERECLAWAPARYPPRRGGQPPRKTDLRRVTSRPRSAPDSDIQRQQASVRLAQAGRQPGTCELREGPGSLRRLRPDGLRKQNAPLDCPLPFSPSAPPA